MCAAYCGMYNVSTQNNQIYKANSYPQGVPFKNKALWAKLTSSLICFTCSYFSELLEELQPTQFWKDKSALGLHAFLKSL